MGDIGVQPMGRWGSIPIYSPTGPFDRARWSVLSPGVTVPSATEAAYPARLGPGRHIAT